MQRFLSQKIVARLNWIIPGILFLLGYIYFFIYNRFHLYYLEQTQLFCYTDDYFTSFISKPGQFIFYLGEFLTQFFVNAVAGAAILTLLGISLFILAQVIFRKLRINTLVSAIIPVLFMVALQSSHLYKLGLTIGLILALFYTLGFLLISKPMLRYAVGIFGGLILYPLAGGFALWAGLLVILIELLYFKSKTGWIFVIGLAFLSIAFPYLGWKFWYIIPFRDAWFSPFPFWGVLKMPLFAAVLVYFPLVIVTGLVILAIRKKDELIVPWNFASLAAGTLVMIAGMFLIGKKSYDSKIETFLGMDHYVQIEEWNKVIDQARKYPGVNQLVTYYTNLALYKTGQLADRMFSFPQHGAGGLQLEWKRDEVTPFFGGEVFYHLNHFNEAYRWAFESMVAKGMNPRSLKRLVQTSIINGHYAIAEKYLSILGQTQHYKKWAEQYRKSLADNSEMSQNAEISAKRKFLMTTDFVSVDLGLNQLLQEHPNNRMAFEYQMATFLLTKNIKGFADNIYRIKDLGYREIPVNYEEALLFCMIYFKKDLVPEGYTIRPETIQRKNDYIAQLSRFGNNKDQAASELRKQFGNTCWYYLHFVE